MTSYDDGTNFQIYDYESGIYCYVTTVYNRDEILVGFSSESLNNWNEECEDLGEIEVEVNDDGELTKMIYNNENWVFYDYEDLYEPNRWYEPYSFNIYAVPSKYLFEPGQYDQYELMNAYTYEQSWDSFTLYDYDRSSYCELSTVWGDEGQIIGFEVSRLYESTKCWFYDNDMKFIELKFDDEGNPYSFEDPFNEEWRIYLDYS